MEPLVDLPPELWMHVATLSDTPTAAGLVRANRTFRSLLQQQKDARLEARRLEREQAVCAKLGQMRGSIAAFSVYTMGNGSPAIRVDALDLKSFTCHCCPVGRMLPIGVGCGNVIRHLLSKNHWAAYRQQVHGMGFDQAAWREFAANARGPQSGM